MGDLRNKIAKVERAIREKAAMDRLGKMLAAGYNPLIDPPISHKLPAGSLHTMAGAPNCRCGAHAVRIYRGLPMCDACEDAAMNQEILIRDAWTPKPKGRKR